MKKRNASSCPVVMLCQKFSHFCAPSIITYKYQFKRTQMRKADLVTNISEKTGIAKVDVLVSIESFFKEVRDSLKKGENVYVRGFGSFIVKKRAAKIGRNIKKNQAIHIPEHFIPAFKPAKIFSEQVKRSRSQATAK